MLQRFQLSHNGAYTKGPPPNFGRGALTLSIRSRFSTCLSPVHLLPKEPQYVKGLVLVNPATSYDRSHWRVVGSLVANAPGPEAFGMAAVLALATTIPDTAMVGASYNGNEDARLSVLVGDTGVALSSIKRFLKSTLARTDVYYCSSSASCCLLLGMGPVFQTLERARGASAPRTRRMVQVFNRRVVGPYVGPFRQNATGMQLRAMMIYVSEPAR